MNISIIVAMTKQGVIGRDNQLPWRLSSDLKNFKQVTLGKPVLMGRKTYQSILQKLGTPLPDRENIILSRNPGLKVPGCTLIHDFKTLYNKRFEEIIVIGGYQIYELALKKANKIYVTEVEANVKGDTYFPDFDRTLWQRTSKLDFKADKYNEYNYRFLVLKRKNVC